MRKLILKTVVTGQALLFALVATAAWAGDNQLNSRFSQITPGAVEQSIRAGSMGNSMGFDEITITEERNGGLQGGEGVEFELVAIAFEGNDVFSDEELLAQVDEQLGRLIEVDELRMIADAITAYYHQKGYILTRAYLPPQTISGGTAVIAIAEGRLGRVIVKGNERYKACTIEKVMELVRKKGALTGTSLEKGLLLLNDYPGMTVKATLVAGKTPGSTDVVVNVSESKIWQIGFDYNNFGSEFVSQNRFGLNLHFFNPFKLGDSLGLRYMTGGNQSDWNGPMWYMRADYNLPVNSYGTRMGMSFSRLKYEVGKELEKLDISGISDMMSIYASHPLARTRHYSWFVNAAIDIKRVSNQMFDRELYEEDLHNLRVGSSWEWVDSYKGRNLINVGIVKGLSDEEIRSRLYADGEYVKAVGSLRRYQLLPWWNMIGYVGANWQASSSRLPTSEEASMGGAGTVRGYPMSDYSGDNAIYGTAELRYPIYKGQIDWQKASGKAGNWAVDATLFSDMGRVWVKDSLPAELSDATLGSLGLGLRVAFAPYAEAKVEWAKYSWGDQPSDSGTKEKGAWYFQLSAAY